MDSMYDIAIIGGGIIGCSIARSLSRFELSIIVMDKGPDLASGITKANSAVIHAGYLNPPGSLKTTLCVQGNRLFDGFTQELGVPFKRVGKLVVANGKEGLKELEALYKQGQMNSVQGLSMIHHEEISKLEPYIEAEHAMLSTSSGITNPMLLTVALAEHAHANGVHFSLSSEVKDIECDENGFTLITTLGRISCKRIINCAGLYSDRIARMAGDDQYTIHPCRGEYFVLDKAYGHLITRMIYPIPPKEYGVVGVHLTPTLEGNILIGPTAEFIDNKSDLATTRDMMSILLREAKDLLPGLPVNAVIQSYSGNRPKTTDATCKEVGDFIIQESTKVPGLINLIGIESPGLTCAPSTPPMVEDILRKTVDLKEKKTFKPPTPIKHRFADLKINEQARLISQDQDHGQIVCRCEHATKREILDALNNPFGSRTINSIKIRTRATMGRCQGGFCVPRIVEIMQEQGMKPWEITLKGGKSQLFVRRDDDD